MTKTRTEYYKEYYRKNKAKIKEKQKQYYRKTNPEVINTKKDHIQFQTKILLDHPEGLHTTQIYEKLLQHQGKLGFTKMQTASYLHQNPEAIGIGNKNVAKKWYHHTHLPKEVEQ